MGYRILSISKIIGLSVNEVYTYFCLLAKTDFKTYVSHVSIETLCKLTGIRKGDTISKHIKVLIENGLIIRKYRYNREMTNIYTLYKPKKDFIRIDLELLSADIPPKLKGFLILLKALCLNNSNFIGYNKTEISTILGISRPTIDKYLEEAFSLGLIKEEETGFLIPDTDLFIVDLIIPTSEHYNVVYLPIQKHLISKGVNPPPFNEKMCFNLICHFSSPDFIIAALQKRDIPTGINCSWQYLAKVLNVDIVHFKRQKAQLPEIIL